MGPLTPKERMAISRARKRGEAPPQLRCSVCGKPIKDSGSGRAYEAGLCFAHWQQSTEGKAFLAESRRIKRQRTNGPRPFRYFGAPPGEDAWPEGPFNRLRLAISSTYSGKGKERGKLFVIWSDDTVTEHENIRQKDIREVTRESGIEVDRSDLVHMAKTVQAFTERIRHYGNVDTYLV